MLKSGRGQNGMFDLNQLSPFVRVAWDDTIYPPTRIEERVIFDYELLYVKDGEIKVVIEGAEYHGLPGDIFFFKPKQRHSIELLNNKPLHQPHLHFDFIYQRDSPEVEVSFKPLEKMNEQELKLFREDITASLEIQLPSHLRLLKPKIIENLFYDIFYEFDMKFPYFEAAVKGSFINLWVQLSRESLWATRPHLINSREQIERVKAFLSHNANRNVSLDELADVANLNKYYLSRLFKEYFGVSPVYYHLTNRLDKAKEMIRFTNQSISKIASQFGFSSIYSFSRAFYKYEGVSPQKYRAENKRV